MPIVATFRLPEIPSMRLCRQARVAAVSLVGVITLGLVPAAVAGNPDRPASTVLPVSTDAPTDPRVCDGWSHGGDAYHAVKCNTAVATRLSWHAANVAIGGYNVYAPGCVPAGNLKFRCLLHGSTAAIAVSWDPVTFKPTVRVGPLAVKVLAASKARVAAARTADAAG